MTAAAAASGGKAARTSSVALAAACGLLWLALPAVAPGPRPPSTQPPARGAARLLWDAPLDLNREDAESFEALAGIGPTRARAIVAGRPYCGISDLDRVAGIGPATLRRLRGRVAVPETSQLCTERGY